MAGSAPRADVRIGHDARAEATGKLDKALREGRIDLAEYERRVVVVQAAKVRKDLTPAVADLPDRISTADREWALVQLAGALIDGRLPASAYADAEELLNRAVTYADVKAVVGDLDAKASHAERDQAVTRIEAAVAGGLLDPAEQHDRLAAVRRATTDAQLAALVADLPAGAGGVRSPRASHADREAVVAQLQDAVEAGLLELSEFDERVRTVYAARLRDELARVVADLPSPSTSAEPAPPAEVARKRWVPTVRAGQRAAASAGIAFLPLYFLFLFLANSGFTSAAIVVGVGSAIVIVGLLAWGVRTVAAANALETARELSSETEETAEPAPVARREEAPPRKRSLGGHQGGLAALATLVLPDGTPVAITGGRDDTAKVWDLTDNTLRHTLNGHTHEVLGVSAMVLPDGVPVAVTVSPNRTAKVWDLRDGSPRGALPRPAKDMCGVRCFSLADRTPVAFAHNGFKALQTWDLRDHRLLHHCSDDHSFRKAVPVVLPGGTPVVVVAGGDGHVRVLDLKTGVMRFRLTGRTEPVSSIDTAVLPDGTPVAVCARADKTIRVWDLRSGAPLHTIAGLAHPKEAVVCTSLPDGTPVVVAADSQENTMAWDLRDGAVLPYRRALRGDVLGAVVLPDRTLVLGPATDHATVGVRRLG
ncbi:WD domain-containing protein, G-beta repeat-containing protein [Amycolatopsis tolypomycina]|uniref:WD domain-containing protein, G-beta repeat-containing protein n=1 Tax=Amycolatopsis tolypomycina TaxID=208445 RepID=A0A1H5D708_9PSEU|nr:DUF1707 domain-containing protein [Amycolatopsis tolypomycina]SED74500.1 WD domain-containing protein, G-beta repeat-containing protein [Amycolatopsis tolypomycina]